MTPIPPLEDHRYARWQRRLIALLLIASLVVMFVIAWAATPSSASAALPNPDGRSIHAPTYKPEPPRKVKYRIGDVAGPIVKIEVSLVTLGYITPIDGIYDQSTATAVRYWKAIELGEATPKGNLTGREIRTLHAQAAELEAWLFTLSDCDEMNYHREWVGLPDDFGDQPRSGPRSQWGKGWRESNCRNEDSVSTWCCWGYWQLYVSLFLKDHRLAPLFARCGIWSSGDVDSDITIDKRRQACGARALLDVSGRGAWALP